MTAIPDPSGYDGVFARCRRGQRGAVRVNPRDGSEATELDLPDILRQHWGMPASLSANTRAGAWR